MGDFIIEHKKISYFITFMLLFYFFIVSPLEENFEKKRILHGKTMRIENMMTKQKILLKNIEELKIKKEILEGKYQKIYNENRNFNSVGEYQNYLNKFLIKNSLEILETGRMIESEIEYIIPYTVRGNEKNIINFIFEVEKDKNINLMKGAVELKKEKEDIKFRFSTGVKVSKLKEKLEIKNRKTNFFNDINQGLLITKYMLMDNNKGIFYIQSGKNLKKYYLKNDKEVVINGEKYFVKIENEKLILKNMGSLGNIIIFNLGENN